MLLQFKIKATATVYCQDSRLLSPACRLMSSLDWSGADPQGPQGKSLIFILEILMVPNSAKVQQEHFLLKIDRYFFLRWYRQASLDSGWGSTSCIMAIIFSSSREKTIQVWTLVVQRRAVLTYILLNFAYFLCHGRVKLCFPNMDVRQRCPLWQSTFSS